MRALRFILVLATVLLLAWAPYLLATGNWASWGGYALLAWLGFNIFYLTRGITVPQDWKRPIRSWYNGIGGVAAIVLAVWSLLWAVEPTSTLYGPDGLGPWRFGPWSRVWTHEQLGKVVIGFWGLVPPLFFWIDWVWLCSYLRPEAHEREVAKHTHDLSRNIWIALVAILTVLFAIKMPFEH